MVLFVGERPLSARKSARLTRLGAGLLAILVTVVVPAGAVGATTAGEPSTPGCTPPELVAGSPLRVATKPFEPFVIVDADGELSGFSIDYWNEVSTRMGRDFEWVLMDTVTEIVDAAADCEVDAAIAGISITAPREEFVDFSQPYYLSGQRIVTRPAADRLDVFGGLARGMVLPILVLIVIVLIVSHIVWFFERGHDSDDFPFEYRDGIGEALWWSTVSVITEGEAVKNINTALGRLIAVFWMLVGLVVVAFFTAEVTATWTVAELRPEISSLDDLAGRPVGTVESTASVEFLNSTVGIEPQEAPSLEAALEALVAEDVDAVVFDAPVVDYFLRRGDPAWSELVRIEPAVGWDPYGIALPDGSPLLEQIDRAVIDMGRDGRSVQLQSAWFGSN